MDKIRTFLYKLMYGRYGADTLYWWLFGGSILFSLLRRIFSAFGLTAAAIIFSVLSVAAIVYAMFRFFSKNKYKRSLENLAFRRFIGSMSKKFSLIRDRFRDRKTHVYKKCPKCKAVLRLPKKKGSHTVRCPKCQNKFDVKI